MKQAFILAAGFGKRLLPLTSFIPKPLFPVWNVPILARILDRLEQAGFEKVFINTHHHAEKIQAFLKGFKSTIELVVFSEDTIRGTGGGIAQAVKMLDCTSPLLIYNGDIVCDIDLHAFWVKALEDRDAAASLLMHVCHPFNNVRIEKDEVVEFGYHGMGAAAYCGICVLQPNIYPFFHDRYPYSLIDIFKKCLVKGGKVKACQARSLDEDYLWADIGTLDGYLDAHFVLIRKYGNTRQMEEAAAGRWSVAGRGVTLGKKVRLMETVIWDGCNVEDGAFLQRMVVTPYGTVK